MGPPNSTREPTPGAPTPRVGPNGRIPRREATTRAHPARRCSEARAQRAVRAGRSAAIVRPSSRSRGTAFAMLFAGSGSMSLSA